MKVTSSFLHTPGTRRSHMETSPDPGHCPTSLAREVHIISDAQQAIDLLNEYFDGSRALPDVIMLDLGSAVAEGREFRRVFRQFISQSNEDVEVVMVQHDVFDH